MGRPACAHTDLRLRGAQIRSQGHIAPRIRAHGSGSKILKFKLTIRTSLSNRSTDTNHGAGYLHELLGVNIKPEL